MIVKLKKRPPVDVPPKDHGTRLRWGRWVYGALLMMFFGALLNYYIGSSLLLHADGLVLQNEFAVAPPYDATVVNTFVQPGERVKKAAPLAQVESVALARSLAELAARQAELMSRVAEAKSKLERVRSVLPFAKQQHEQLQGTLRAVEDLQQKQLANARRIEESVSINFSAREKVIELQAQESALSQEVQILEQAHNEAERSYQLLRRIYDDGRITAPSDGIVGPSVAVPGEVLVSGAKLMTVFAGEPYVLAYLPDNYLFGIHAGQSVLVSTGARQSVASVEAVLPLADSVPPEFQNNFRPRDRSQLIRVRLPADQEFALHQKVQVSQCFSETCESLPKAVLAAVTTRLVKGLMQIRIATKVQAPI
jgi:multidrug resistance efflux pump